MDLALILGAPVVALIVTAMIAYRLSGMHATRSSMSATAARFRMKVETLRGTVRTSGVKLENVLAAYVDDHRLRRLAATPVEALKDSGADRVRWGSLHDAGIRTLADLDRWHPSRLLALPGIGQTSAEKIARTAAAVRRALVAEAVPLPDGTLTESGDSDLVAAAFVAVDADEKLAPLVAELEHQVRDVSTRLRRLRSDLAFASWAFRGFWVSGELPAVAEGRALTAEIERILAGELLATARGVAANLNEGVDPVALRARVETDGDAAFTRMESAGSGARVARSRIRPDTRRVTTSHEPPAHGRTPFDVRPAVARGYDEPPPIPDGRVAEESPTYGHAGVVWVPPGKSVDVAGFTLLGGMVYVGCTYGAYQDPSFINPVLPIDRMAPDRVGGLMGYWPSYSTIPSQCRAAYLEWLVGGRRDRACDIGYVFLFLYGLERRLLLDRAVCAPGEEAAMLAEVARLLDVYGQVTSFRKYAQSFLAVMHLTQPGPRLYVGPPPVPTHGEPSMELRVGLGQAAADGRPLPAPWAFAWCCTHPPMKFSQAASRCPRELSELFAIRYAQRFGAGMVVPPGRTRLSLAYKAASSAFGGGSLVSTGLSDVFSRAVPKELTEIAESCARDLEEFARVSALGRLNATARMCFLPDDLLLNGNDEDFVRLREWLEEFVPIGRPVLVDAHDVFARWTDDAPMRMAKGDVTELAHVFQRLGFGIDPDPRFGGGSISATDRVALLRLPPGASSTPSAEYAAAALIVRLCTAVARADEFSTRGERERVMEIAGAMNGIDAAERLRLQAFALRLFETKATVGPIKRIMASFPTDARDRLGRLLVGVAAVDGRVTATEISVLTKLFSALGLDPAAVYREAHARSTDTVPADEPVIVRRIVPPGASGEFAIPPLDPPREHGVRIDERVLARKQAETAEVLAMLAPIFADEPVAAAPRPTAPLISDDAGLDARHAALVRQLVERRSWSRADVDSVCERLGLLTEGALEVINDAAFVRTGGPVVEGEDPLDVDQEAIRSWMT